MTCEPIRIGASVGFVCSRSRVHRCSSPGCKATATKRCDFKLRNGRTCDKWLCEDCAVPQGRNRDHCPDHPGQKDLFHGG